MGLRVTLSILLPRLVLAGLHRAVQHQVGRLVLLLGRLEVLHHVQGRVARRELLRALLLLVLPDLLLCLVLAWRDAVELVAELPERLLRGHHPPELVLPRGTWRRRSRGRTSS